MNSNMFKSLDLESIISRVYPDSIIISYVQVQELWSGYGSILRLFLKAAPVDSIIIKLIKLEKAENHPRGWNTDNSHSRKVKSYEVEKNWYANYADLCFASFRVPKCLLLSEVDGIQLIILEDLDSSGFSERKASLSYSDSKVVIKWLAHFHANFLNMKPEGLWEQGSYWHLATRKDEFDVMQESKLKNNAALIDQALIRAKFQTLIHGDAKVANFCFSKDPEYVSAVDFQYVGKGIGMIDLAYFMGSCFNGEECACYEDEILEYYFSEFNSAYFRKNGQEPDLEIEKEWRYLYPFAVADFARFLYGWMPNQTKLNQYTSNITESLLSKF